MSEFNFNFGEELEDDQFGEIQQEQQTINTPIFTNPNAIKTPIVMNPRERTGSLADNVAADFKDMADGFVILKDLFIENGPSVLWEVAKEAPGAIAESYKRWYKAAMSGRFLDEAYKHPLEFMQDIVAPIAIATSMGASLGIRTAAAGGQLGRIMSKAKVISDATVAIADPITSVTFLGGRAGLEKAWRKVFKNHAPEKINPLHVNPAGKQPDFDATKPPIIETNEIPESVVYKEVMGESKQRLNLNKLDTSQQAKDLITDLASEFGDDFDRSARGVVDWDTTVAEAAGIPIDRILTRKPGQSFNASEAVAAKGYLLAQMDQVIKARDNLIGQPKDVARAALGKEIYKAALLQEQVEAGLAESGRALNILKLPVGSSAKNTDQIIRVYGGKDKLDDLADMLMDADTPEKLAGMLQNISKVGYDEKAFEVWYNWGLLSGPRTHMTNILSNSLVALWSVPETFIASGVGQFRKSLGSTAETVATMEAKARIFGIVEGAKDGLRLAKKSFSTEEAVSFGASRFDFGERKAFSGKTGKFIRIPGRLLMAEDAFFQSIGFRQELNALAYRKAAKLGLEGEELAKYITEFKATPINKLSNEIRLKASAAAQYQTFTQPLGKIGQAAQSFIKATKVGKIIVPFIRTPTNIVKFAVERSPIALASQKFREGIKKGGPEADLAISRMMLGTTVMAGSAALAQEGYITGSGPVDPEERAALRRTGWQPYSLRLPYFLGEENENDAYYSFSRLEPLGIILGISADWAQLGEHFDDGERDQFGAMAVAAVSNNLTSKTWLRGLGEFVEVLNDPQKNLDKFTSSLFSTIVPTLAAQTTSIIDPTFRQTEGIIQKAYSRLPGVSHTLVARIDLWGNDLRRSGGLGPDLFSPVYMSIGNNDPVNLELNRIGVFPSMPEKHIGGVELTQEQFAEYTREAGRPAYKAISRLVNSSGWKQMNQLSKITAVDNFISAYRDAARNKMRQRYPELISQRNEYEISKIKLLSTQF